MLYVKYLQNDVPEYSRFPEGETATPCDGWLYIYDDDGHILGMFPEKIVLEVRMIDKAGETTISGENTGET